MLPHASDERAHDGAAGQFYAAKVTNGAVCSNSLMGDPNQDTRKACFVSNVDATPAPTGPNVSPNGVVGPTGSVYCAPEGGTCTFTGVATVSFGAEGHYNTATLTGGTPCTNDVFLDPIVGSLKACFLSNAPAQ
ncbi:MAG: hypothetical protein ABI652_02365 [Acidobacteriota bacterium]